MTATELRTKKITMATLKSFIKRSDNLYVEVKSAFDGMHHDVRDVEQNFRQVSKEDAIGHRGAYCVGSSSDCFKFVENDSHYGIEISNSWGKSILWTQRRLQNEQELRKQKMSKV